MTLYLESIPVTAHFCGGPKDGEVERLRKMEDSISVFYWGGKIDPDGSKIYAIARYVGCRTVGNLENVDYVYVGSEQL